MKRTPPSQKIRYQINELLNQGLGGEEDVTTVIFRLGVERLVQEMLEQQVADYLGREHYQRLNPKTRHRRLTHVALFTGNIGLGRSF